MTAELLHAALTYAARGWPVFPLHHPVLFGPKKVTDAGHAKCSCRRPQCENQGKHPRTTNGLDDATTDTDIIRSWWKQWPDANIGLLTGVAFDALDLDGPEALDRLDALGPPGDVAPILGPMVVTGRGVHLYLRSTGAGNRAGLAPGVDWRGLGGYVVAPPSVHYLYGDRYQWSDLHGIDTPTAPVPTWLADVVHKRLPIPTETPQQTWPSTTASNYGAAALERQLGRLALAPVGTRNHALNASAFTLGRLVPSGHLDEATVALQLARVALQIGLGDNEIEASIASGLESGKKLPRQPEANR